MSAGATTTLAVGGEHASTRGQRRARHTLNLHQLTPSSLAPRAVALRRCCLEGGVSGELVARLNAYPRMREVLARLPPKLLALATDQPPVAVELEEVELGERKAKVIASSQPRCASATASRSCS